MNTNNATDVLSNFNEGRLPSIEQLEVMIQQINPHKFSRSLASDDSPLSLLTCSTKDIGMKNQFIPELRLPLESFGFKEDIGSKKLKLNLDLAETTPQIIELDSPVSKQESLKLDSLNDGSCTTKKKPNDDDFIFKINWDLESRKAAHANSSLKHHISFYNRREKTDPEYLSSRCDVVYKTILRDFRRYFINRFKQSSGPKKNKYKFNSFETLFRRFWESVKNQHFPEETDCDTISFYIGSLVCPQDIEKHKVELKGLDDTFTTGKSKKTSIKKLYRVHDALYKFSMEKISNLMKDDIYYKLFKVYYTALLNNEIVFMDKKKNNDSYIEAFKMLLCLNTKE